MQFRRLFFLATAGCALGSDPDIDDGCKFGTKTPPACPHPSQPVPRGPYSISRDLIKEVPGVTSVTSEAEKGAIITYPTSSNGNISESFPLLVFGHGAVVSGPALIGDGYHTLFNTVASYGFVVVAPLGCKSGDFTHDMLATADACRDRGTALHPGLAAADFSRTGFFGHSNGGCSTQELAGERKYVEKYNIKAAVSMHCGCPSQTGACRDYGSKGSNVPFMYTTAAGDPIAIPAGNTNGFDLAGDGDKIVWIPKGGSHFEPADSYVPRQASGAGGANREDPPIALFFACHVRGEHCEEVYGASGDAICRNDGSEMATCKVHRAGPSPPTPAPTPVPTPTPAPTPGCTDQDVSCRSLAETYCGTAGLPSGNCLRKGCPEDTYTWELKEFSGGQCHFHCTCKSSEITV